MHLTAEVVCVPYSSRCGLFHEAITHRQTDDTTYTGLLLLLLLPHERERTRGLNTGRDCVQQLPRLVYAAAGRSSKPVSFT